MFVILKCIGDLADWTGIQKMPEAVCETMDGAKNYVENMCETMYGQKIFWLNDGEQTTNLAVAVSNTFTANFDVQYFFQIIKTKLV